MKWEKEERLFLTENYNEFSSQEISKVIGKSKSAVLSKAWKLGLKKDLTRKSTKSIKNINGLPKEVQQILIGSLLGDGTLEKCKKNSSFYEAHCLNQESYARWKAEKLSLLNPHIFYSYKNNLKESVRFHTKTFLVLNQYRNTFYPLGKKHVTKEILNQLEPLGLAVWIMDDGTYDYNGNRINIATEHLSYEEHLLMKEWFENKFNISPLIYKHKNQFFISFGVKETKKLIEIIKLFIIPSMTYKIGEDKTRRENSIKKYKEYRKRKDVKERRRLNQILYRNRPDIKEKMRLYNNKPEVKERKRNWAKLNRKILTPSFAHVARE
jgi:hypothetical protein